MAVLSQTNRKAEDAAMIAQYREWLVSADQKSQESFDKTVLTLSGGALALSFAFIKDIVGDGSIISAGLLVASWCAWAASLSCVLVSFLFSQFALRKAISQVDAGAMRSEAPGGWYSKATISLNIGSAVFFIAGVVLISAFVYPNISIRRSSDAQEQSTVSAPDTGASAKQAVTGTDSDTPTADDPTP